MLQATMDIIMSCFLTSSAQDKNHNFFHPTEKVKEFSENCVLERQTLAFCYILWKEIIRKSSRRRNPVSPYAIL